MEAQIELTYRKKSVSKQKPQMRPTFWAPKRRECDLITDLEKKVLKVEGRIHGGHREGKIHPDKG